jgi:hypothetical protein
MVAVLETIELSILVYTMKNTYIKAAYGELSREADVVAISQYHLQCQGTQLMIPRHHQELLIMKKEYHKLVLAPN